MLGEIVARSGARKALIDEQLPGFDSLRDLERNAPEVIGELREASSALEARLPAVAATLAGLDRFAAAIAAVAGNVEAQKRARGREGALTRPRRPSRRDRRGRGTASRGPAAVTQATQLLDASISRAPRSTTPRQGPGRDRGGATARPRDGPARPRGPEPRRDHRPARGGRAARRRGLTAARATQTPDGHEARRCRPAEPPRTRRSPASAPTRGRQRQRATVDRRRGRRRGRAWIARRGVHRRRAATASAGRLARGSPRPSVTSRIARSLSRRTRTRAVERARAAEAARWRGVPRRQRRLRRLGHDRTPPGAMPAATSAAGAAVARPAPRRRVAGQSSVGSLAASCPAAAAAASWGGGGWRRHAWGSSGPSAERRLRRRPRWSELRRQLRPGWRGGGRSRGGRW